MHLLGGAFEFGRQEVRYGLGHFSGSFRCYWLTWPWGLPWTNCGRIFGLRGFGEAGAFLLAILALAVMVSYLSFALFLRGVALVYQNETLAKSVRSFAILLVVFLACNIFLNNVSESVWKVPDHPVLGRFLFTLGVVHFGMMIVLPVWFLRLLYQTHESINGPMAA